VSVLIRQILKNWPGRWQKIREKNSPQEADRLQLDNGKAQQRLGWKPQLTFAQTVAITMDWYRNSLGSGFDAYKACRSQIMEYDKLQ